MLKLVDGSEAPEVGTTQAQLQETIAALELDENTKGEFVLIFTEQDQVRMLSNCGGIENLVYTLELAKMNCLHSGG